MISLSQCSLRTKLTALVIVASSAGLLAAFLAITVNELRAIVPRAREALTAQAATIAFHAAAAMIFSDELDATHSLVALRIDPNIVAAALYAPDGRVFARYQRDEVEPAVLPADPDTAPMTPVRGHLAVVHPVMHANEQVGTLYLLADLNAFRAHLLRNLQVAALLIAVGIGVAVAVSAMISRLLAAPLQALARVAENVTTRKDYSLRAVKRTEDEIGLLIDAFNTMLERIEEHDDELRHIQSALEVRVRERTAELETINRDLSEQIAAREAVEGQLIVARDRAEAANRAKSTFLANMSHDLRTPLTAVIGYSELIEEDAVALGNPQFVEDLRRIQTAAGHLLNLLSDLLDLSRIEVGRMELQPEVIDLIAFVSELESTARPLCRVNRNRLEVTCDPDVGTLYTDRTRLRQVLFNLINNAAKFTRGGEVRVAVLRDHAQTPAALLFRISDTGIGMTPAQLGRVFEPFVQAEPTTALTFGGSGLGLAICRRCCDLMGARIDVESRLGQGSTFTVIFPAPQSAA